MKVWKGLDLLGWTIVGIKLKQSFFQVTLFQSFLLAVIYHKRRERRVTEGEKENEKSHDGD